ncbi:unnamed protein product, partial [Polarella glacialis]
DPTGSRLQEEMQIGMLIDSLLAASTCAYVCFLLLFGVFFCCCCSLCGRAESAMVSCLPPALNFGVSALLLKALAHVAASLLTSPWRLELWVALPGLAALVMGVRSSASTPLRRALEAHDNLSVLASYGVLSGAL